ncbi:MAG: hypothetical protein E7664_00070 [Ruminococcaceae bacterium]|nr:hypothetical protein [Oscillospiraceae bacterium]
MKEEKAYQQNEREQTNAVCVLCGALTKYRADAPIYEREYYVEAGGQLCRQCYYALYIKGIQ